MAKKDVIGSTPAETIWLKHGIGADECLTRQKIKHSIREYIIIFTLFITHLTYTSLCLDNIPSYIFYTFTMITTTKI